MKQRMATPQRAGNLIIHGKVLVLALVAFLLSRLLIVVTLTSPSYLVCFAVGEFISVDAGQVDGRPVKVCSYIIDDKQLHRCIDAT